MNGVFIQRGGSGLAECTHNNNTIKLLSSANGAEVILMEILSDSVIWMSPGEADGTEFYMVQTGKLLLELDEGEIILSAGDNFSVAGLEREISMKCLENVNLLCISNKAIFDDMHQHMGNLRELVEATERKNQYTYDHGKRVMHYALLLAEGLGLDGAVCNIITMAAALHDVGKCFLSDHILGEDGPLSSKDVMQIKKHPLNSYRLIAGKFGEEIANAAQQHHERLDGSGYPFGLKENEISIEAKIIAVADVFDAMTTDRPYKKRKSFWAAIEELESLTDQYDGTIVAILRKLIVEKEIKEGEAV